MLKNRKLTITQFVILNIFVVSLVFLSIFYFLWVRFEQRRFKKAIKHAQTIYLNAKKEALKTIVEQFYFLLKHHTEHEKNMIYSKIDAIFFSFTSVEDLEKLKKDCYKIKNSNPIINFLCVKNGKVVFSSDNKLNLKMLKKEKENKFAIIRKIKIEKANATLYFLVLKNEFNEFLRMRLLNVFKDVSFDYSGYLFIVNSHGKILLSAHKIMNVPIHELSDKFGIETERIILEKALREGEGFVEYTWFKTDLKTVSRKISYLKYDRNLKWIFGAGFYLDDIKKSFAPIYRDIKKEFNVNIARLTFLMAIILFLDLAFLVSILRKAFSSDYKKISWLLDRFEHISEEEIRKFNCKELTFSETCQFASRIKGNLIEIKMAHKELLNLNKKFREIGFRFKSLAEQISNGVAIIGRDFTIEFVNRGFCNIFECRPKEARNIDFLTLFPGGIRGTILNKIEETLATRKNTQFEHLKIKVNGKEKFVNLHFSRLMIDDDIKVICTIVETTEREKLIERLEFLTNQYRKAEEMASVGNWIFFPDLKKFWASNEAFKIYELEITEDGMIPSGLINAKIFKDDLQIAYKTTLEPLKNKRSFEGIFRIEPVKGKIKYVKSRGEPVLNSNGDVVKVEGVLMDITDLKNVEIELERQIELLERTQMIAKVGYWEYDFDKKTFFMHSSFFNVLLGKTEIPQEDFFSIVAEVDRDRVRDFVINGFKTKKKLADTFRVNLPGQDGERFAYFESEPVIKNGVVVKRTGWTQDITDLKSLEKEIEIEKAKLINTINSLSEGVVILDVNLNVVFENFGFSRIFKNYPRKEKNIIAFIQNLKIKDLSDRINKTNFKKLLKKKIKYRWLFKDSEYILTFDIKQLETKGFDESGYVMVVEDITHKEKYTEEVIKSQNMRLLNKIAASLAHDLNNLLGSILGKISILEKKDKNIQFGSDLRKIMRNIKIAKALATQFLIFSKSGKPVFAKIGKKTIEQIINDLADFVFSGTSIVVNVDIEKKLWTIRGDFTQIAQIILNLFSNARDALKGKGEINVVLRNIENENPLYCPRGDYVLIKVSDNGPGIPENRLKEIFNFFVGYKKEGFGLGLAIVKNIVDSHNGCLNINSRLGEGTTFEIYLPALKGFKGENFFEEHLVSYTEADDSEPKYSFNDYKIAVLEDEQPMQETIFDLMEFIGVEGDIFGTGEELLEAVKRREKKYHIAILDLTVKGGSGGKEIIGELKKICPDIITVVSSGYSKDPVMAKYKDYGFDFVLPKPYALDEFEKVIQCCIKKIRGE